MAVLNIGVDFRYRRDAFRGAGGEPWSHLSRCARRSRSSFTSIIFHLKSTLKYNRASIIIV